MISFSSDLIRCKTKPQRICSLMTDNEKRDLNFQNSKLFDELQNTKSSLQESRTALINAQLTIQALAEQCSELIAMSRAGKTNEPLLNELSSALEHVSDTRWLAELRLDAFQRGFSEGYTYSVLKKGPISNDKDAWQRYKELAGSIWPSVHKYSLSTWRKAPVEQPALRFDYDPEKGEAFSDALGPFMEYSIYADLKFRFDLLKEEVAGYRWILHDKDAKPLTKDFAAGASKNRLRQQRKEGSVRVQYGKSCGDDGLFVFYGAGVAREDRALLLYTFGSPTMGFDYEKMTPTFTRSFVEELSLRGYDLSTLKFSISKHV